MEKPHFAIFPFSEAMGHLLPLVEFVKRLCTSHGLSVTLIISKWLWAIQQPAVFERLASSTLDIHFREIPDVTVDEDEEDLKFEALISKLVLKAKTHIEDALQSLLSSSPISAFVTDFFCSELLDVGAKLNLPTYLFFPSSASV